MSAPTTDRERARDAAFDALIERALGHTAPDLTERVLAAEAGTGPQGSGPRMRERLGFAAAVVLGLAAVVWTARHLRELDVTAGPASQDPAVQDPVIQDPTIQDQGDPTSEPRLTHPLDREDGHRLLDEIQRGIARHSVVYELWFPVGNGRGRWLESHHTSSVVADVADLGAFVELVRGCIDAPAADPIGIPEAQAYVDLQARGGEVIRAEFGRKGPRLQMRIRGLGYRTVDGELATRVGALIDALAAAAEERYRFVADAQALAETPRTLREVFAYGIEGDDLAPLAQRPELVRARLVGRRVDESPHEYQGVDLGEAAIAHLRGCPSLARLELVAAQIDDAALEALAEVRSLRHLSILDGRRCSFTAKGLQHLTRLPHLESIEIERCPIDDQGLGVLAGLAALKRVRLENIPSATGAGVRGLLRAPGLRELSLTKVSARGLFDGGTAPSLRRLEVVDSELSLEGVEAVGQLASVLIDGCALDVDSAEALGRSRVEVLTLLDLTIDEGWAGVVGSAMQRVTLGQVRGTDAAWAAVLAAWRRAPALHTLAVRQSQLSDARLEALGGLQQVRVLDLRYNRELSRVGLDRLAGLLPSTRLLFSEPKKGRGRRL